METAISSLLAPYQKMVNALLEEAVPSLGPSGPLREACGYALLGEGKRFRPALVLLVAAALQGSLERPKKAAIAVEYFHTASLIADDLPCMDDETDRRGKASLHRAYGEANALLVSYALIAAGYDAIAAASEGLEAHICPCALRIAAENSGLLGLIGGQFLDLTPPDLSRKTLLAAMRQKTASLFETSFAFGWLFGGGAMESLSQVREAASHFGMAFQIADDLGDREEDLANGRPLNIANQLGCQEARELFEKELSQFFTKVRCLGLDSLRPLAALLERSMEPAGLS